MTEAEYHEAMEKAARDYEAALLECKRIYDEQRIRIQAEFDGSDFSEKLRPADQLNEARGQ